MTHELKINFPKHYEIRTLEELPSGLVPKTFFAGNSSPKRRLAERLAEGWVLRFEPDCGDPWIGVFGIGGFPNAITCIASTSDPDSVCIVTSGEGYVVDTKNPDRWLSLPLVPIMGLWQLPENGLTIMVNYTDVAAVAGHEIPWISRGVAWDGIRISKIGSGFVEGTAWDAMPPAWLPFRIDIDTGELSGGPRYRTGRETITNIGGRHPDSLAE